MNPPTVSLWQELAGFGTSKNPIPPPDAKKRHSKKDKASTPDMQPVQEGSVRTGIRPLHSDLSEFLQEESQTISEHPQQISAFEEQPLDTDSIPQQADGAGEQITREDGSQQNSTPTDGEGTKAPREEQPPMITRSGRRVKWTPKMLNFKSSMASFISTTKQDDYKETPDEAYYDALHQEDYRIQDDMINPIAFLAKTDADTMYYHQAMRAPDRKQFVEAMVKEFNDHCDRGHWVIVPITEVPKGVKILDAIWSMKRKRDIKTQEVIKWKARLTVHGGQQQYGINYFETYAPVVNWFSVRLFMALSLINGWHTRQIDFVLAYPQAPIECDLYMKMPKGIVVPGYPPDKFCLKLVKNIYGQKQAGRVWNQHLCEGLRNIGFTQSKIDECVWYRNDVVFMFYVDDGIFCSPRKKSVDDAIADLRDPKKAGHSYDLEDKGDITDYLGINFEILHDGRLKLSQPHLIDQILKEVRLDAKAKPKQTPAPTSTILQRDLKGAKFNERRFNYRSVIGKLNYLEKGTRPDIAYATHQLARFSSDPKESHGDAVIWLARYLKGTRDCGIILDPKKSDGLEVYADADFVGNWHKETAHLDIGTAKSRSGYIIQLFSCPLIWHSKLQTQIALSTCEAEYYSLSQSLREAIPIMNLLSELHEKGFSEDHIPPKVHCKAFEDNSGALELARAPKMRPRTKHINIIYHHFRQHVRDKLISIHPIKTKEQRADIFTKPVDKETFKYLRKQIMNW
jgi:hypothetical protein